MEPVDFVILWVDGSDPTWLAEKNRYLAAAGRQEDVIDAGENRYRDWGLLPYWFRAVERYAPWVHRIHFVTCGQEPSWLRLDHPRLHCVHHRDFIPGEFLPTFSANPIELHLHRIPDLSQQFVYFNDDFFLTAPVQPEDFFVEGLPCDALSEDPYAFTEGDLFEKILVNDIAFVNRHFNRRQSRRDHPGKWYNLRCPHESMKNLLFSSLRKDPFFGIAYNHLPQPYRKEILEQVWALEPELLRQTCTHRFRDVRDVNQYVFSYYQLLSGCFYPYSRRNRGRAFSGGWCPEEVAEAIVSRKYRTICLNDAGISDVESAKQTIARAFRQVFPEKSSFER